MKALLWCHHVVPGLLDLVTGLLGLVERIGDPQTLGANVSIPESARSPGVVMVGLVRGLGWGW